MRWFRRLLITGLALVTAVVVLQTLVLPAVARREVLALLRRVDPAARFRYLRVSPWRLRVSGLEFGRQPWLSADFAEITFDPFMLLRGRVDRVTVSGARWRVGARGGVIDRGFAGAGAGVPADLIERFGRIDVPGATVILDTGGGDTPVPVRASLVRGGAGARLIVRAGPASTVGIGGSGGTGGTGGTGGPVVFDNATLALDAVIDARSRSAPVDLRVSFDTVAAALPTLGTVAAEGVTGDLGLLVTADSHGISISGRSAGSLALARLRADEQQLSIGAVAGAIESLEGSPFVTLSGGAAQFAGRWRAQAMEAVSFHDRALGDVDGQIALREGRIDATVKAVVPGGARLDASGSFGPLGDGRRGAVHVEAPRFTVDDAAAFARTLGLARGAKVGGRWALTADVRWTDDGPDTDVRVEMEGASLTLPDQEVEVTAIDGVVDFDRLAPVGTPGPQRVTAGAGRIGSVGFGRAVAEFRLDASGALCVDAVEVVMEDGARVTATPFRVEALAGDIRTTLAIEDMSLAYWLPLLTNGRATGDGMMRGRVPVVFRAHGGSPIQLGEGSVQATAPGGWIRTTDADQLSALLEQSDPRFRTDERMRVVEERLIDALRDYAYDTLRFDLVQERDGLTLRVFTKGRGRRGASPQEIGGLTVNIHDIDGVLSSVLSVRRAMDRDSDRALERFFDE